MDDDHHPEGNPMSLPWRDWTTPIRLRVLSFATVAVAIAFVTLATVGFRDAENDLRQIGHETGPQVEATSDLYFALADMDAQIANVLLVGDAKNLGTSRAQALEIYDKRRQEADADVQQAAAAGADIRPVLDALGRYEALAAQTVELSASDPRPGRPDPAALARYRQATDLMRDTLLPAATRLIDGNAAALEDVYGQGRAAVVTDRTWAVVLGLLLLGLLAGTQLFVNRRFRRQIVPALLAATVLAAVAVGGSIAVLTAEAEHLRGAKKDAFDSVLALSRARAISYDANADESRFLVDPQRATQYEAAFTAKSRQLMDLGDAGLSSYDAALAEALATYRANQRDLRFHGFYGIEFRNVTFTGERAAAERTVAAYQVYQRDDRRIRQLVAQGDLDGAIAFCTSYAQGDSNWAFGQYDEALTAVIGINRDAFAHSIAEGEQGLRGRTVAAWLLALAIAGLVLIAVRPRLAEYR
jgi:hypothetical protein